MHQCMYVLLEYRIECSHILIAYSLSNLVKIDVMQLSNTACIVEQTAN